MFNDFPAKNTVYDRMFYDFPAKNTVYDRLFYDFPAKIPYIHRMYMVLANPTHASQELKWKRIIPILNPYSVQNQGQIYANASSEFIFGSKPGTDLRQSILSHAHGIVLEKEWAWSLDLVFCAGWCDPRQCKDVLSYAHGIVLKKEWAGSWDLVFCAGWCDPRQCKECPLVCPRQHA